MKRNLFIILCCTVSTMLSAQHQDCRLWYDKPAKDWNEALPVGNGRWCMAITAAKPFS